MQYPNKINDFRAHLKTLGRQGSSIESYCQAVKLFYSRYDLLTEETAYAYKEGLVDTLKPRSINLRVVGLNRYMKFMGEKDFKLSGVREQQKPFLENVISFADYEFLKKKLREDGDLRSLLLISLLGATGARVSEIVKFKAEHIRAGHVDFYGKGKKYRRVYIPRSTQETALPILAAMGVESGHVFRNSRIKRGKGYGKPMSTRGIAGIIKTIGQKYGIDKEVMHPHSFRHLFAKQFLLRHNDIVFLADLMGHEELETTRIYLRKTATEQRAIVDEIIDW
ncbi:MAG: tyrosine-type recombinase/integrase [Acidaminococcales bacterium]|jgi:site-specific recombinase XerD|nr:tyrosine-type recombinase/integrase [Acidaminococcales bacterium]